MKPTSRFSCRSRTKSIGKVVSRMTKSLAYVGVLVLVAGLLLTTCVGSAWSMELLTAEEMASIRGTDCPNTECGDPYYANCQDQHGCPQDVLCWGTQKTNLAPLVNDQVSGEDTTATQSVNTCLEKNCTKNPDPPYDCIPWGTGTGTDPVDDCYYP